MAERMSMTVVRALAGLELAALRHHGVVRRRLNVGEEELTALLYLAHHGSVPGRRVAEITGLSRSGAGAMIRRLEEDGFVTRRNDPADRRVRFVELSATGRSRLRDAYREVDEATERFLADRPPEAMSLLAGLAEALADAAGGDDTVALVSPDPVWRRWG
ncbi:MarR family winged helix-turn-helix transcriptional regulator [Solirubrobacter soli]|uniref:MarR family winged helix-turn-helix transcriptional regulator n=1 Tax=Solirubrobacter soli TaxID=363832 RepID=UPI0003F6C02F|nr:MarR family transcriptional regulator [Solirubrobacter soli]